MSLLHPALLLGLGFSAIPILLHLLLRAKPKRLIFPALRLIQQSRRQNVRRMQLRHLWLLLLRMLVFALLAFGLTRPSLPAANYSLLWYEWLGILGIIAAGLGSYFGVMKWWQRQNWPRNQLLTRRTMLRGSIGAAASILLVLGVGWPYIHRVSAEMKDPAPRAADNLPVAAVFLFDNSPSMSYRQGNQSRLQSAQQIARDHLSRLSAGSKVAVTSSHETTAPPFSLDLQAARSRIDGFEIKAGNLSLNDRLRTVILAHEEDRRRVTAEQTSIPEEKRQDRYLREIYLFCDLTRSAWRDESSSVLRDELARLKFVSVYLIDVGETNPTNVGISSVKLSSESVPTGGTLKLDVGLTAVGHFKSEQTVEFFLSGRDGKLVKRGQQTVAVDGGVERQLAFEIPQVEGPLQQGEFRIVGSDPLSIDDVGYFTVRTLPQLKVLVVAENASVAFYWQSAIEYVSSAKITDFQTKFLPSSQLRDADLKSFDVVFLINLNAPDETTWTRLHDYVEAGGGLGVFLGTGNSALSTKPGRDQIDPVAYNKKAAQSLLPGELKASVINAKPQSMDLRNSQHLLLKRLESSGVLADLGAMEVRGFWKVEPSESAVTVAKFDGAQGIPALLERRVGRGRVMLMTTSVNNDKWNDLVGSALSFVFADQLTQYLSQQSTLQTNHLVGDEVALPLDREQKLRKVVLRMPDYKQRAQEIPADAKNLRLNDLTTIGSYQVDSAPGEVGYHSGFSLNLPASESDLRRLEPRELDSLLGEGRYTVNRDPRSLERNIMTNRLGQEMYSFVVGLLVIVFALEQFTAAWFYRTDEA